MESKRKMMDEKKKNVMESNMKMREEKKKCYGE